MRIHVYLISATVSLTATAIAAVTGFGTGRFPPFWQHCALSLAIIVICRVIIRYTPRLMPVCIVFETAMVFILTWQPIIVICYAAQTFNFELRDNIYRSIDYALGFDAANIIDLLSNYPVVCQFMAIMYNLFFPSMFAVMAIGGYYGASFAIAERTAISIMLAFLFTAALSSILPAYGYGAFIAPELIKTVAIGATPVAQLEALRDGSMRILDPGEGGGIITFPSMHWGLAIILLCTTERLRWLFFAVLPISIGFMITAMVQGAHYIADAFVGALVGGFAVMITDWFLGFSIENFIDRKISMPAASDGIGTVAQ